MDWQALLTMVGIVLFVIVMMRGCGGMAGGGCGMGSRRRRQELKDGKTKPELPPEIRRR